ncbi:hypothetical protein [Myceligenerans crystallogenes]|uniref:DUF7878 domain-containing protein n=1 Tax=Myceligenerans crystallogenes TaxID=316335 RepID=A0ABP4ZMQ9_9MICO
MTEATGAADPSAWLHLGAPDLTDLRAFHTTGRRITPAELLLYVEADLQIRDGDAVLFNEPRFEVAELAAELVAWVGDGSKPAEGFVHSPDAYAEPGVIRITQTRHGWVAGSCFTTATTAPRDWETVRDSIGTFMAEVRVLTARSMLDAGWSLIETIAALCRGFGLSIPESRSIVLPVSGREREFWDFQERFWDAVETFGAKDDPKKA